MVFIPTGLVVSTRSLQSTAAGQVKGRKAGSLEHCSLRCADTRAGLIVPHSFPPQSGPRYTSCKFEITPCKRVKSQPLLPIYVQRNP